MSQREDFLTDGFVRLGPVIDSSSCADLYEQILASREWSGRLFRSEADCDAELYPLPTKENPKGGTNPGRGICNLAEELDLRFIEENAVFRQCVESLVGAEYDVLLKKFVVGVPRDWVPEWLQQRTTHQYMDNLNAYIQEPYRDVTYFRGIDYHMDIMDRLRERPDIITVYVYLTEVTKKMSPLHVIKGSHRYANTIFPHYHCNETDTTIELGEGRGQPTATFNKEILTGPAGSVNIWTALTMHGTQPTERDDLPRISLRFTLKKAPSNRETVLIDTFLAKHGLTDFMNTFNNSAVIKNSAKSTTGPERRP